MVRAMDSRKNDFKTFFENKVVGVKLISQNLM